MYATVASAPLDTMLPFHVPMADPVIDREVPLLKHNYNEKTLIKVHLTVHWDMDPACSSLFDHDRPLPVRFENAH